jgi:glyoxylase-like metal-dependent hydrolase (beta-lactamase superfamily II)
LSKAAYAVNFAEKIIMDRRELLKSGVLAGATLAFPTFGFATANHQSKNEVINQGFIQIKLNDLTVYFFSDGHILLNNPQPIFAPGRNSADVKQQLAKLFLPENKLEAAINVMVIKSGGRIILVDTGSGYHFGETGGWLPDNLKKAGIKSTDVTDVFITHAHVDHIGGIVAKNKTLVYPNAQYFIAKKEFDFWMSENPDFSNSKNTQSPAESVAIAQSVLSSVKDKLHLFNDGDTLLSWIKTELAAGHTPGHTIFTVFSGDKSIRHIVDTVHTPLLIAKPEWGTQWDVDFNKGVSTRKKILNESYLKRTLVMTTHLPWPGLGYIDRSSNAYLWRPFSYFTPNEIDL